MEASAPAPRPEKPPAPWLSRRALAAWTGTVVTAALATLDLLVPSEIFAWVFVVLLIIGVGVAVATPSASPPEEALKAAEGKASLRELFREAVYLGLTGFGGGLAVLTQIEHRLVERRRWIPPRRFLEAAALAQSLPGAVATNALALVGLRFGGLIGALAAVVGFVLPAFVALLVFALLYPHLRSMTAVEGLFRGLNPAVAGLVAATAVRLGGHIAPTPDGRPGGWRALSHDRHQMAVMIASAFAVALAGLGVVEVILVAGLLGVLRGARPAHGTLEALEGRWRWLMRRVWLTARAGAATVARPWWRRWRDTGEDDLLGLAPIFLAMPLLAPGLMERLVSVGQVSGVFLRAGTLTFGGGFVMVPLLEAELVKAHAWLSPQAFADAVALGQITPGPVVITATFVGYSVAGLAGAIFSTVSVFAPAFLMMLIVGTSVERFRRNLVLQAFLQGIQPAVVGVLVAAAASLLRHGVEGWPGAVIALAAFVLLVRWRVTPARVMLGACAAGMIWAWIAP